jgi:hypothetical protein
MQQQCCLVRTDLTGKRLERNGPNRPFDRGYLLGPISDRRAGPAPPLCGPFGVDANRDLRCITWSTVSPRRPISALSKTLFACLSPKSARPRFSVVEIVAPPSDCLGTPGCRWRDLSMAICPRTQRASSPRQRGARRCARSLAWIDKLTWLGLWSNARSMDLCFFFPAY